MPDKGDYYYDDDGTFTIYDGSRWLKSAKSPYKPFNPPDILVRFVDILRYGPTVSAEGLSTYIHRADD